jgi:S-adenosylmethionine:tRNA ribosyltransferase-isomerase
MDDLSSVLAAIGEVPLPPYIHRDGAPSSEDNERYQTVYASRDGSVAAPTAGLHFTAELLDALEARGVGASRLTLHVGPGTFTPIRDTMANHRMEAEYCEVSPVLVAAAARARACGGRVVAVGTTCVRALETAALGGALRPFAGPTNLFLRPGHRLLAVDALVTNLHLPGSTLLCLVMAFAGEALTRRAYEIAVEERYRFYSFGDAMLII